MASVPPADVHGLVPAVTSPCRSARARPPRFPCTTTLQSRAAPPLHENPPAIARVRYGRETRCTAAIVALPDRARRRAVHRVRRPPPPLRSLAVRRGCTKRYER